MRWLLDPGAPRFARRDSSRGPSVQPAGPCPACPARRRLPEGVFKARTSGECGLECVPAWNQGVDHRLVSWLGLAASLDAGDPGLERRGPIVRAELVLAGHGGSHLQEERPVEGAAGAPDRRHERHADGLQEGADVLFITRGVNLGDHGRHASIHVDPVVAVSDRRVELGQLLLVRADLGREGPDPAHDVVVAEAHAP